MNRKKIVFFFLAFVIGTTVFAQQRDFEIWTGLKYKTIHTKRVASTISVQSRLHENASRFFTAFADFNLAYKLTQNFEVSGAYVFIQQNTLKQGIMTYHQYYGSLNYERKINGVNLNYGLILQNNHKDLITDSRKMIPGSFGRNRLKLTYKVKKSYFPFVYSEVRHRLNDGRLGELNRLRIGGGLGYRLDSNSRIEMYYLYQSFFTKIPRQRYVIGLAYKFRVF